MGLTCPWLQAPRQARSVETLPWQISVYSVVVGYSTCLRSQEAAVEQEGWLRSLTTINPVWRLANCEK